MTELEQFIERAMTDPEGVRAEFEAEILEEHGQEWWDQNERYMDAWWKAAQSLMGFPVTNEEAARL